MATAITHYLDSVRNNLRLDLSTEKEVISELEAHIEDELQELKEAGLSEEEAVSTCVRLLGSAKTVARQIYEAHNQGTWRQALLAAMPHLLFGLMFALNWWWGLGWLLSMLVLILGTAFYGWWRGKPTWLFPWLGYSLLPVAVAGLLLLYLPRGWFWVAVIFYGLLAAWLVYATAMQTIKRDWLYSSLMLLPLPVMLGWFIAVRLGGRLPDLGAQRLHDFTSWIGISFLALGVSVAVFIRLGQRWSRLAVLIISGFLTLTMVTAYAWNQLGLNTFLGLLLLMLSIFLIPALLDRKIRRRSTWLKGRTE